MLWPHTKATDNEFHCRCTLSISAQENSLRFDTTSFLVKAQNEPLIEMKKITVKDNASVVTLCLA